MSVWSALGQVRHARSLSMSHSPSIRKMENPVRRYERSLRLVSPEFDDPRTSSDKNRTHRFHTAPQDLPALVAPPASVGHKNPTLVEYVVDSALGIAASLWPCWSTRWTPFPTICHFLVSDETAADGKLWFSVLNSLLCLWWLRGKTSA